MTIHIDYDSELCVQMIALLQERAWMDPELSLRVKITTNEDGVCALLVLGGRGDLRKRRVTITPFSDRVMVTFFWTPEPSQDPNSRPGWSLGECSAYMKINRFLMVEARPILAELWGHVIEHFTKDHTP